MSLIVAVPCERKRVYQRDLFSRYLIILRVAFSTFGTLPPLLSSRPLDRLEVSVANANRLSVVAKIARSLKASPSPDRVRSIVADLSGVRHFWLLAGAIAEGDEGDRKSA